ncbi:hypothetical protein [Acinetobacter baumannii]|uniref:hypothetical protein n=1 Tax=Acinetobacter baumannii TaxID=470 RepID=UPI003219463C
MDKPMTFNEWMGKQGNLALVHANCCRIAYEAGQQSQQAKVEELQKRVDSLTQTMEELLEEMKYPTATFEEVIVCGVKMLEQALKGDQYDEHRKKAEEAISKGASLTNHRIEL